MHLRSLKDPNSPRPVLSSDFNSQYPAVQHVRKTEAHCYFLDVSPQKALRQMTVDKLGVTEVESHLSTRPGQSRPDAQGVRAEPEPNASVTTISRFILLTATGCPSFPLGTPTRRPPELRKAEREPDPGVAPGWRESPSWGPRFHSYNQISPRDFTNNPITGLPASEEFSPYLFIRR